MGKKVDRAAAKFFGFSEPGPDFHKKSWRTAVVEKILGMNCREQIREYLIAERMRHWLMIARHPFLGKGCPKRRARKNYWALVRKYQTLAERHNLRETDVF